MAGTGADRSRLSKGLLELRCIHLPAKDVSCGKQVSLKFLELANAYGSRWDRGSGMDVFSPLWGQVGSDWRVTLGAPVAGGQAPADHGPLSTVAPSLGLGSRGRAGLPAKMRWNRWMT